MGCLGGDCNMKGSESMKTVHDSELEQIIMEDGSLAKSGQKRNLFKSYAALFSEDLLLNLYLTSIELDDKYLTDDPVSWRKFLNHTSVKKFVDGFLNEKAEKEAMKTLGLGTAKSNEALKVKEMVDSKRKTEDNSNIVVVFLPQKVYK